jgi:hypothetical protein
VWNRVAKVETELKDSSVANSDGSRIVKCRHCGSLRLCCGCMMCIYFSCSTSLELFLIFVVAADEESMEEEQRRRMHGGKGTGKLGKHGENALVVERDVGGMRGLVIVPSFYLIFTVKMILGSFTFARFGALEIHAQFLRSTQSTLLMQNGSFRQHLLLVIVRVTGQKGSPKRGG